MRLSKLHLARYGHFTDYKLDFGESADTTDLHLVYGENEAGKSTTLSAIVDLLFGMLKQSPYNFVHNYKTMEIGATLHQNGHSIDVKRFKTRLTDSDNQSLATSIIDTHGLNRDDFQSRFSFDEKTLNEGGEAILNNNGDLGAALFSATSGISDFTSTLANLTAAANDFYEPAKQKGKTLFSLKDELADIDLQRKELDVNASYWSKQEQLAADHKSRYDEFSDIAYKRKKQLDELTRQRQAVHIAHRYHALKSIIATTNKPLPIVPPSWHSTAKSLIQQHLRQQAQHQQLESQQHAIAKQKTQLTVDDNILSIGPSIEALRAERALYDQRSRDIQDLLSDKELLLSKKKQLQRIQNDIIPDSDFYALRADTLLSNTQINELRAHLSTQSEILTALTIAEQEQTNTASELERLDFDESEKPTNTTILSNYLSASQDRALHIRLEQLNEQLAETNTSLDTQLAKLNPWRGDADKLLSSSMPSRENLAEIDKTTQQLIHTIEQRESNIDQLNAELQSLQEERLRSETNNAQNDFLDARSDRDVAWKSHTESLDANADQNVLQKTARDYALKQQELDQTTDRALADAMSRGEQQVQQNRYTSLVSAIKKLNETLDHDKKQLKSVKSATSDIANSLGLDERSHPKEIIDWLTLRDLALETIHKRNKLQVEIGEVEVASQSESRRLKDLIIGIDESASSVLSDMTSPAEVIALAQSVLTVQQDKNAALIQQQEKLSSLHKSNAFRQREYSVAKEKFSNWESQWQKLTQETPIHQRDINHAAELLDAYQELNSLQVRLTEKESRINALESSQIRFTEESIKILKSLKRDCEPFTTQLLDKLFSDYDNETERQANIKLLTQREDELTAELNTLKTDSLPVSTQLDTMREKCGVEDTSELETTLEQIKEQTAQQEQLAGYEKDLMAILRSDSAKDAIGQLTQLDEPGLSAQIEGLEKDVEQDNNRLAELHHEYRKIQDELDTFNSNATVAQLSQKRQNLLLSLEAQAIETMRVRLGKIAIEQGVRHFREQHRSSMLDNAKRAFVAITCGGYIDLTTQPGKKNNSEDLVGIKDTGQSTLASDMSTGTRAQLYLALRIAAYQDYCKTREPLPFVADDIMESFDEQRTQATLVLLNDMAKQGQIIYLTHHRHVLEIAKDTLKGKVKIHELPRRSFAVVDT